MKRCLLLGAGFTKYWGGLLMDEFWKSLYALTDQEQAMCADELKKACKNDFEQFYSELIENRSLKYRNDILESVLKLFNRMNKNVREHDQSRQDTLSDLERFLIRFKYHNDNQSAIFTLNQDTFVEHCLRNHEKEVKIVGVSDDQMRRSLIDSDDRINIDDTMDNNILNYDVNKVNYLKLHGSSNWFAKGQVMVIGKDKIQQINSFAILKELNNKFGDFMKTCNKILVIGYSFKDLHINDIIFESINRGAELFIIDTGERENLIGNFVDHASTCSCKDEKKELIRRVTNSKYYQCSVNEIFPLSTTCEGEAIIKFFFGETPAS